MGQRKTAVSCVASLGLFALGATLGAHRGRRRERRARLEACRQAREAAHGGTSSGDEADLVSTEAGNSAARCGSPTCRIGDNPCCGSGSGGRTERGGGSSSSLERYEGRPSAAAVAATVAASDAASAAGALDCPVCLGEVVLPRMLACGHTVCTRCLAALAAHERRPGCPVCRRRIRVAVDKLPENFMVKAVVEARAMARGADAVNALRAAEAEALAVLGPFASPGSGGGQGEGGGAGGASQGGNANGRNAVVAGLRPAWNWFKWTVIIVTEFGAFLVSLKEVLESAPTRSRRYQRIV